MKVPRRKPNIQNKSQLSEPQAGFVDGQQKTRNRRLTPAPRAGGTEYEAHCLCAEEILKVQNESGTNRILCSPSYTIESVSQYT